MPNLKTTKASLEEADFGLLEHEAELSLIRSLINWPRVVEGAAKAHEPHRIAFYLYELASEFHKLWNKGNDEPNLRFVIEERKGLTLARLGMVRALGLVIAEGLQILGVKPLEEMH